jgi:hypothetical protein
MPITLSELKAGHQYLYGSKLFTLHPMPIDSPYPNCWIAIGLNGEGYSIMHEGNWTAVLHVAPAIAPTPPSEPFLISLMPFAHNLYEQYVDDTTAEQIAGVEPGSYEKDMLGVSVKCVASIVRRLAAEITKPE